MLIWSLLSMIGFGIAVRTLQSYEHLHLFTQKQIGWMKIFGFLSIIFLNLIFQSHAIALWALQFVIFLSPWWLAGIMQAYREKIFQEQMFPILDSIIISMRSGASMRAALERCGENGKPAVQMALKEFLISLQYKKNRKAMANNSKIHLFFDELQEIDELAHKQVERLRALKRRLSTERNFRRKSSQATMQVRAQAWIMLAMFSFLLVYICCEFGFWANSKLIFFASLIFLIGFVLVLRMGRNYVWKI